MVIAALSLISLVALAALALCAFAIREFNLRTREVVTAAMDRVQARSIAEVSQVEDQRSVRAAQLAAFNDAIASVSAPVPKRKMTDVNGNTYDPDELETY